MSPTTCHYQNQEVERRELYRSFIQTDSDLRRGWVTYPKNISSQGDPFYKEEKSVGKAFEIQGEKG